jgi:hypothetical protein
MIMIPSKAKEDCRRRGSFDSSLCVRESGVAVRLVSNRLGLHVVQTDAQAPPRRDAAHVNQDRAVDVVSTTAHSRAAFSDLSLSSN